MRIIFHNKFLGLDPDTVKNLDWNIVRIGIQKHQWVLVLKLLNTTFLVISFALKVRYYISMGDMLAFDILSNFLWFDFIFGGQAGTYLQDRVRNWIRSIYYEARLFLDLYTLTPDLSPLSPYHHLNQEELTQSALDLRYLKAQSCVRLVGLIESPTHRAICRIYILPEWRCKIAGDKEYQNLHSHEIPVCGWTVKIKPAFFSLSFIAFLWYIFWTSFYS